MTDPYLFERGIGQQMGDLCRLAVGESKVTQTGEIVTLEEMIGRGVFGVSVEVPYTSGGVSAVNVTRCGKVLFQNPVDYESVSYTIVDYSNYSAIFDALSRLRPGTYKTYDNCKVRGVNATNIRITLASGVFQYFPGPFSRYDGLYIGSQTITNDFKTRGGEGYVTAYFGQVSEGIVGYHKNLRYCLPGVELTDDDTYTGDTYTITLPTTIYGGSIDLEAGTVTSRYAADGTELAEPVVTETDPIAIPILAGVNNVWADVGTVTVSYYAADAETFRPALWYPTIYRGLTSARYLIKRASGAIASFDDAVAAPLVGLRVALPWRSEGWQSVSVTRANYTELPETLAINAKQEGSGDPSPENVRPIHPGLSFELDDGTTLAIYGGMLNVIESNITEQAKFVKLKATGKYGTWDESTNRGSYFYTAGISTLAKTNDGVITNKLPLGENVSEAYDYNAFTWFTNGIIRWIELGKMTLSVTEYNNYLSLNPLEVVYSTPNPTKTFLSSSELSRALAALGYNGDTYTITLPTTIYGGSIDVVTGQLVATHDANGNLMSNQKLYFLDPVNISALAGVNNVWSDAGDVAVSYRIDNG